MLKDGGGEIGEDLREKKGNQEEKEKGALEKDAL